MRWIIFSTAFTAITAILIKIHRISRISYNYSSKNLDPGIHTQFDCFCQCYHISWIAPQIQENLAKISLTLNKQWNTSQIQLRQITSILAAYILPL